MNIIKISVPFAKRHLHSEIKLRGGKFDPDSKTWVLEETVDNQAFAELVTRPNMAVTPKERVSNVAKLATDLLNALKYREYKIVEAGDRVILESTSIAG